MDEIIICEEGFSFLIQNIIHLRNKGIDLVLNTQEDINSKQQYVLGSVKANYKIGFRNSEDNLLTHKITKLSKSKYHRVDRALSLLDSFNFIIDKSELNYFYKSSDKSIRTIEDYIVKNDLTYKMTVLLNVSNKEQFGFWGIVNFQKLIKYISNYDVNTIVTAAIEDIEVAERISNGNHLIYYNNDFDIYSELVKKSDLVISPDSFTIQLASAFKIPVFCLFTQKETPEMMNVPYNSDFDFAISDKPKLESLSLGNVLNSFVPYLEFVYKQYLENNPNSSTKYNDE